MALERLSAPNLVILVAPPPAIIANVTLYENLVIGGFLFELGVRMASVRPDLPWLSVNLLQQTPLDRPLGDVLLANADVCRLVEFKRSGKLTDKEKKKLNALRRLLRNSNSEQDFAKVSREVHWYIEIKEPRVLGHPVESCACPYIDFDDDPQFTGIQEFAGKAALEACEKNVESTTRRNRKAYLNRVFEEFGSIEKAEPYDGDEGFQSGASGAFMVAINDKAETYWVAVPSIKHLFMTRTELVETLQQGIEPETQVSQDRSRGQTSRSRGRRR